MDEEKRAILNIILEETLDRDRRGRNNAFLQSFIPDFVRVLKNDRLFKDLYLEPYDYEEHGYYSDLRVDPVDKIVVYLKLKLPFQPPDFEIIPWEEDCCYAHYSLKKLLPDYLNITDPFAADLYLRPSRVRTWFDNIVENAVLEYNNQKTPDQQIIQEISDSFIFLQVNNSRGERINIHLVPVIDCIMSLLPTTREKRVTHEVYRPSKAILVPKPYLSQNTEAMETEQSMRKIRDLWLINTYEEERRFLTEKGCAKKVIKIMKLLRKKRVATNEHWIYLDTYYLKTVVMWMVIDDPSEQFWKEEMFFTRLQNALTNLSESLSKRNLTYIFTSTNNMFRTMSSECLFAGDVADDIGVCLNEILRMISGNSDDSIQNLLAIFA